MSFGHSKECIRHEHNGRNNDISKAPIESKNKKIIILPQVNSISKLLKIHNNLRKKKNF